VVELGDTRIRCLSTPGHTPGTMSFLFDVEEKGRVLRAGMHGGVGMNTLSSDYIQRRGLPLSLQQQFLDGLDRLSQEHVDIFIGNHVGNNDTVGKGEALRRNPAVNPFIDENAWPLFLERCRANAQACFGPKGA
jgi:metallo-beta-lactamase class B